MDINWNKTNIIFRKRGGIIMIKRSKSCIICGNTKIKELEIETLYSDGDGNDCIEKQYMCKEGKGCSE